MSQCYELMLSTNEWLKRAGSRRTRCALHCVQNFLCSMTTALLILTYQIDQASAQVNVEQSRLETKEGLSGSIDGGLTLIRGNVSLSQLGLGARLDYTRGVHSPFVQLALNYGEKESVAFLNQSYAHTRWTAMWLSRLGTELFAQLQENSFRSLVLRQLYGGGLRSELASGKEESLALGVGAMYEREVYREPEELTAAMELARGERLESDVVENNLRLTNYLSMRRQLKWATLLQVGATLYYQPLINKFSDYRVLLDLNIEIKLSERLRLVESLGVMYDSEPPAGVQRADLKSMSTLRIAF